MTDPTWARSGAITSSGSGSSVSATFPATVNSGEVAIFVARIGSVIITGWPAGFTSFASHTPGNPPGRLVAAWKRCDGTEGGTTVTATASGTAFYAAVLHLFTGCTASGTPIDTNADASSTTPSTSLAFAAITTSVDAQLAVHLGIAYSSASTLLVTETPGGSWTKRFEDVGVIGSTSASLYLETLDAPTAGVIAGSTSTLSGSRTWLGTTFSLRSAATNTSSGLFFGSNF